MNTDLDVQYVPDNAVRLTGKCVVTGKEHSVVVPLDGFIYYFGLGLNIGTAFPELPKEEREFLISGTSPDGWQQLIREATEPDERSRSDSTGTTGGC